jgi:hypothetical protein
MEIISKMQIRLIGIVMMSSVFGMIGPIPLLAIQTQPKPAVTETVTVPRPSNDLLFAIYYLYRSQGQGEVKLLTNESVLHSGDHFKIVFTPAEDCYVYILNIDSQNKVVSLFPMDELGGVTVNNLNPVKGGQTYYLPAPKKAFFLNQETGPETIYFLATRTRDTELEAIYQRVIDAQKQGETGIEEELREIDSLLSSYLEGKGTVGITVDASEKEQPFWNEDEERFATLKQRLEFCEGCVHVLRFDHQ